MARPALPLIEYVTDGFGRRIAKKVGGAITQRWLYGSAITPIAEASATGVVAARYVYDTRKYVPDFMVKGGVTYRMLTDHVGSVRLVVNTATGAIAQRIDYDTFGRITQNMSPGFQPFAFAGGLYDADTGLVRLGARDYDPSIGRWSAKDPTGFRGGDANLYAYSYNDPINYVDRTGRAGVFVSGEVSGGFGPGVSHSVGYFKGIGATPSGYFTDTDVTGDALGLPNVGVAGQIGFYTGCADDMLDSNGLTIQVAWWEASLMVGRRGWGASVGWSLGTTSLIPGASLPVGATVNLDQGDIAGLPQHFGLTPKGWSSKW